MVTCPICKGEGIAEEESLESLTANKVLCMRCGEFILPLSTKSLLEYRKFHHPFSSWIRERNSYDEVPLISETKLDEYFSITDKSITTKYELLLKHCIKQENGIEYYLEDLGYNDMNLELLSLTWCKNEEELEILFRKAIRLDHLASDDRGSFIIYRRTFDGIDFVESLGLNNNSNKIFMAFRFTEDMKKQFELTVKRAVEDASNNKLEAVRVSSSTTDHDTKIDDELIGMLKASKAVIADFTGQRNAVYYEAGFAMGLGIPVIWTCKESDADGLSFDTRQYPHIIWKNETDLYEQVVNRLRAKIL